MMEYLTIGRITKTCGLKGEVKIYPTTHFRGSRYKKGNHVFILNDKNEVVRELIIKAHRTNGNFDNVIFEGIDTIEEAEKLLKCDINVLKDRKILKKGEYFYDDLLNKKVYFDNGTYIGEVKKIEEYTSYITLRIKTDKKDVLIPFVKAFIKDVNLENNTITINYIEGLLWNL